MNKNSKSNDLILRQKAERLMKKKSAQPVAQLSDSEAMKLIHELEVHQVELELQNGELVQAQHNVHEIAKKYTELYDLAPSGYFTLSKEGEITAVNLYGAKMLGRNRNRLKNSLFGFFVSDDTRINFNLFLGKIFSNKNIETCEVVLSSKNNKPTYISLSGRVTTNTEQCFVTAVDVTGRKQAEEALQISLAKYQVLFNSFPLGISLSDKHGNIIEINEKAEELLGLTENKQLSRKIGSSEWHNIIQTDGSPFPPEEFPSVIALKENRIVKNIEMGIVKGENEKTWINVTAAPVPVEDYGVVIVYNDITEHLKTEEALRKSEERLRITLEQTIIGTFDWDIKNDLSYVSPTYYTMLGYEPKEGPISQNEWVSRIHPDDQASVSQKIHDITNGFSSHFKYEKRIQHADGSYHWINVLGRTVERDENDMPIRVLGVRTDITERKLLEEELLKNSSLLNKTEKKGKIGGWSIDLETSTLSWTEETFRILEIDLTQGEPKLPYAIEFIDMDFRPMAKKVIRCAIENGKAYDEEWKIITLKGNIRWVHSVGEAYQENGKTIRVEGSIHDITDRKKAEDELRKSEERFHSLFDNMNEGVALHNLVFEDGKPVNYRIVEVNNAFLKITGISRDQAVGKLCTEVYGTTNPPFFEEYSEVVRSKKSNYFDFYFAPMEKHFGISVAPWSKNGFATIFSDISNRIRAEEEINLKNDELKKINAEKDKFFSIIAHDLRGPFSTFLGFTEMMVSDLNEMEPPQILVMAEMMQKSASNLNILLNNLLEWAKIQQGLIPFIPAVIQLRSIADKSTAMVLDTANNKGIELACDIQENLEIFSDIHVLQTVIRNLVSNAIKFTPEGGKVSLSAKVDDDKNIEISIRDTGIGMSKVMVDNLFRIDVKTNRLGTNNEPSSGLGLLLCREFIEKYGGKLWVESEEGKGSIFYFTIPLHVPEKETITKKVKMEKKEIENIKNKLKILIAEDDEASEFLLTTFIKKIGEIVISAKNGAEAVEACMDNPDIDLVLMDLQMPEMDGIEATRQIRLFNSNLVIIAQTAYAVTENREKAMKAGCTDYMLKPVKKNELLALIQKYFSN